jgi:group II intron reverse transcriptase/maturase
MKQLVIRIHQHFLMCIKAFTPVVPGNGLDGSGSKSSLRRPANFKKVERANFAMIRITNLIRLVGLTLGIVQNITGNSTFLIWISTRMLGFPLMFIKRSSIKEFKKSQGSKAKYYGKLGTMGNPKRRKSHGFGGFIVECNTRREPGIRNFYSSSNINFSRCVTSKDRIDIKNEGFTSVIHDIANIENLTVAYESIKSKPGDMTSGGNSATLAGITSQWLLHTATILKAGKFRFGTAPRANIPKAQSNGLRLLGVVKPRDKIILTAILQILEPFYENKFLNSSHGFRPNRGCHTALKSIKNNFSNSNWVIEGDISKCFDSLDHDILLNILRKEIKCDKTIALIKKSIKSPYIKDKNFIYPARGILQGSPLSPLLCNIYLHEFDTFVESQILSFNSGKRRKKLPAYRKIQYGLTKVDVSSVAHKEPRSKLRKLPSKSFSDSNFKRLVYIRYANNFVIGVIGSLKECEIIRDNVKDFLFKSLALELNIHKTVINNFNRKKITFLGTYLSGNPETEKVIRWISRSGKKFKTRTTSRTRLMAPIQSLLERGVLNGFFKRRQDGVIMPTSVGRLVNLDHPDILKFYNQKIRGILDYYSFVDNAKSLGIIIHGLKHSCALTLALKLNLRHRAKVFKRFGSFLEFKKEGTQSVKLFIPGTFRRTGEFRINPPYPNEILDKRWNNKLSHSNFNLVCGKSPSQMHHVRKIGDLKARYRARTI